jgi:hypothetical protein
VALTAPGTAKQTGEIEAPFDIHFKGPHGVQTTRMHLKLPVCRPPQIAWSGQYEQPEMLRQAPRQRLALVIRNQNPDGTDGGLSNGVLRIRQIELTAPSLSGVRVRLLTPLPLDIKGGAPATVEFELDLTSLRGQSPALQKFRLRVQTNFPEALWDVPVRTEPMQIFEGVVAIDFGSSNSCCAVWAPGEDPDLVPLDEEKSIVCPTVVRYKSLQTVPPETETGARPKRLAAIDAKIAASTLDRLKLRLGAADQQLSLLPEKDEHWVMRSASDAAADYLRSIREQIEVEESAFFRDFILTHPARCSLRQIARLRSALGRAFGENGSRIAYLQEPVAALIGYMLERSKIQNLRGYTVASFDLGGGTTDIAVVSVKQSPAKSGRLHVKPRILYCRGDRFGGEDLTDFLLYELSTQCQHYLAFKFDPACYLIGPDTPGAAELDIRRNKAELQRVAEQFKASLSLEKTAEPDRIDLRVLENGHARSEDVPFAQIKTQGNGPDLKGKFLAHALREIEQRVKLLERAVEVTGTDLHVIQLSGKTAYLPAVSEAIKARFPESEVRLAPNPKECVVTGACLLRSLCQGEVILDFDIGTQRMTSTIGAFDFSHPFFQPILRMDHPIPESGLVAELPNAWNGSDPVVLWEDLDGTNTEIAYAEAARHLNRLGTWIPAARPDIRRDSTWTVRVTLRDFSLMVEAVHPYGDHVVFAPLEAQGE